MKARANTNILPLAAVALMLIAAVGCAGKPPVITQGVMDNPKHHVFTGMQLLQKERAEEARDRFDRALQIDARYSPAHAGRALVCLSEADFEEAQKNADRALKYAAVDGHTILARLTRMQLAAARRERGQPGDVEREFKALTRVSEDVPAAYLLMGRVYKEELRFADSATMFRRVLELNRGFVEEADREYSLMHKIERAQPGSAIGREMALVDSITRADIAALFIEEMLLEKVFALKQRKTYSAGYRTPGEDDRVRSRAAVALPDDVREHPLREDIGIVLGLKIRGLEPFDAQTFAPDEHITRANYALMIEDILVKIKDEQKLSREFIGNNSPFPDVRNDHYAFNAIMVCTTRGILEADMDGAFGADATVSGADALLALRKLREELKSYQVQFDEPQALFSQRRYRSAATEPVSDCIQTIAVSAGADML